MRLQLNVIHISNIHFGDKTVLSGGTLLINRSELANILMKDPRLSRVEIELAHPGEECRILQVSDVIEPRAKVEGGENFPGVLGRGTAGEGITCVLRGTAIVMSDYTEGTDLSQDPNGNIVNMSGPAAELSAYGKTHNLVIRPYPAKGIKSDSYRVALKLAEIKAAAYLAEVGKNTPPDEIEIYDHPALPMVVESFKALPRVAYIFQIFSAQFRPIPEEPIFYGGSVEHFVPTIVHPNEVFDGAIINPYRGMGIETYHIQNHPIIQELYRRHGRELCFVGVIVTIAHNNELENQRAANIVANLAKWVLGADGAILTKCGGGAAEASLSQTATRCEEIGVKTVLTVHEMAADSNPESCTLFNPERIDALISMGSAMDTISLPAMKRIIGSPVDLPDGKSIADENERMLRWIRGAWSQVGNSMLIAVRT